MRRRRDRDHPVIVEKRRKTIESQSSEDKAQSKKPAYGLPSYLPAENDCEDEEMVISHQDYIKSELKKRSPDLRKIDASMQATFANRRREIVTKNMLVKDIIEAYPALCDCQQV